MNNSLLGAWSKNLHFYSEMFTYSGANALHAYISRNIVLVLSHSAFKVRPMVPRACAMVAWGETATWQMENSLARQMHRPGIPTSLAAMQRGRNPRAAAASCWIGKCYKLGSHKGTERDNRRQGSWVKDSQGMDALSRPLPSGPSRATNPGAQTWNPWDELSARALHMILLTQGRGIWGAGK